MAKSGSIAFLGHATFQLTLADERVIVIDPWLKENPACPDEFKSLPRCDMVFLTHGHFDHIGDVADVVKAHDPVIVGNLELCAALEKKIGKARFSGMNTGGTQEVDGVRVSLTPALHSSGVDTPDGPMYAGMPNGLVVDVDGLATLYHAGDTDVFSDMQLIRQLYDPKISILPIGDYFTMGAKGAAIAAGFLQPQCIIPCHYATFPILAPNAEAFRNELSPELTSRVVEVEVGKPITWTAEGAH